MRNFQDAQDTCKQSFISAFLIWMTVPLIEFNVRNNFPQKLCRK